MKQLALLFTVLLADFCPAQSPNVLLICVDDLRPELGCYGVDYISSPNIDSLARRGRIFRKHYVQAPTCGASRYTLLTGRYGTADNGALFQRAKQVAGKAVKVPPSMPEWFRQNGYVTAAVGKVSHHPGGLGGPDWNDPNTVEIPSAWDHQLLPAGPWQHPRGWMHGLANGEIRIDAGKMDVLQATEGDDSIYPDGPSVDAALYLMQRLADKPSNNGERKPFFLACGILRPHLPFGAPAKYLQGYDGVDLPAIPHPDKPKGKTTWHSSGEFMKYNRWGKNPNTNAEFATKVRRHYAACVSYADAQVGRLLNKLDELKLRDDTLIVLWGDHGWHLGEHAVWGKHTLFEESLRSPLIVSYPKLPHPGATSDAMVETLDIFPTLTDLANLPTPDFVHGVSLRPILTDPEASGHDAFAYRKNIETIRTNDFRLILHKGGHAELYDHRTPAAETVNVADDHADVVAALNKRLQKRLGDRRN